jgi:hypothetical protein
VEKESIMWMRIAETAIGVLVGVAVYDGLTAAGKAVARAHDARKEKKGKEKAEKKEKSE